MHLGSQVKEVKTEGKVLLAQWVLQDSWGLQGKLELPAKQAHRENKVLLDSPVHKGNLVSVAKQEIPDRWVLFLMFSSLWVG